MGLEMLWQMIIELSVVHIMASIYQQAHQIISNKKFWKSFLLKAQWAVGYSIIENLWETISYIFTLWQFADS